MFLAVTSRDEANLIASLSAHRMGVGYTVARVSNPEYFASGSVLSGDQMGIDLMINPERECARETFDLLRFRGANRRGHVCRWPGVADRSEGGGGGARGGQIPLGSGASPS